MEPASLAALRDRVVQHPWEAVAAALVLGAWFALEQPRVPKNRLARHVFAFVGAIAIRAARDAALAKLIRPYLHEMSRTYTTQVA